MASTKEKLLASEQLYSCTRWSKYNCNKKWSVREDGEGGEDGEGDEGGEGDEDGEDGDADEGEVRKGRVTTICAGQVLPCVPLCLLFILLFSLVAW